MKLAGCGVIVARVLWEDLVRVQISTPRMRDVQILLRKIKRPSNVKFS